MISIKVLPGICLAFAFISNVYAADVKSDISTRGCQRNPCGVNAVCRETAGGRPVCSCPPGYSGDPFTHCNRGECVDNVECRSDLQCQKGRCVDPCVGACGSNANCKVRNHVAVCSCPKGFKGDPFTSCRLADPEEQCNPSPCGLNTKCEIVNGVPTCSCLNGYVGSPLSGCRPITKADLCEPNPCGTNAICEPGHDNTGRELPVCKCLPGYTGKPLTHCSKGECLSNSECPDNKACINYQCVNPCIGKCGSGAECEPKTHLAVCKCPRGTSGDAFVSCR